ncbi:hypothetical protein CLV72_108288 [Allonocardiopsis opalescens]|uniref:Uncharacterized protein n=1 Tax=Allonocardiopsis opalescens TaxID=1144618 RepID=A0A2T0PXL9_9ACTN|nr:hypothetical protein CLV72_108288 [Allonocardiopsis opalescens]
MVRLWRIWSLGACRHAAFRLWSGRTIPPRPEPDAVATGRPCDLVVPKRVLTAGRAVLGRLCGNRHTCAHGRVPLRCVAVAALVQVDRLCGGRVCGWSWFMSAFAVCRLRDGLARLSAASAYCGAVAVVRPWVAGSGHNSPPVASLLRDGCRIGAGGRFRGHHVCGWSWSVSAFAVCRVRDGLAPPSAASGDCGDVALVWPWAAIAASAARLPFEGSAAPWQAVGDCHCRRPWERAGICGQGRHSGRSCGTSRTVSSSTTRGRRRWTGPRRLARACGPALDALADPGTNRSRS